MKNEKRENVAFKKATQILKVVSYFIKNLNSIEKKNCKNKVKSRLFYDKFCQIVLESDIFLYDNLLLKE